MASHPTEGSRMRTILIAVSALILVAPRLDGQSAESTVAWMNENVELLVRSNDYYGRVVYAFTSDDLCTITVVTSSRGAKTGYWKCVPWSGITAIGIHPSYPT